MTQLKTNKYAKTSKPSTLHWTASPTEFIELSKALFLADCFNNGKITFKDLFDCLSAVFNLQIQNPHTAYTKMKERVEDRTLFLSKLKEAVEKDMDKKDYQ